MSSYFDDASLVMIPSGYKTSKVYSVKPTSGDGDLTFTRSNDTATRVGPDGLIEKVRTNLLTYSQNFTSAGGWGGDPVTATANYGTAPDGTQTSTRLVFGSANQVWQKSVSGLNGNLGVFSLYIKGTAGQTISINDGFVDKTITLTSGWTRVSSNGNVASSSNININTYSSVSARDFEVWGGQVELGDIATDYIATTTAAVSVGPVANVPRLDYLNSSCPRLLLEPQRTSLVLFSEQMDNASWIKLNGSVTANAAVSPDGYTNADSFVPNTTSGIHALRSNQFNQSATAAHSWFVKANGYSKVAVRESEAVGNYASFNLATGTLISTNQTGSIVNYGNGWYRLTLVDTTTAAIAQTSIVVLPDSYTTGDPLFNWSGDGTKGVLAYGAQVELGAYATSYIPTLGAAVTRGADLTSKTGISSLIGQTEGTIFAEIEMVAGNGQIVILTSAAGNEVNRVQLYIDANRKIGLYRGDASVNIVSANAYAVGTTLKIAAVYKANDYALYVNGVSVGTDTSATAPVTPSVLYLGQYVDGSKTTTISAKQTLLFKTRLTNAQLAELTTL